MLPTSSTSSSSSLTLETVRSVSSDSKNPYTMEPCEVSNPSGNVQPDTLVKCDPRQDDEVKKPGKKNGPVIYHLHTYTRAASGAEGASGTN